MTTAGASESTLGAEEVLDLRTIMDAQLSPDGRLAVYAVSAISANRDEDRVQLCVVDVASGESRELTSAAGLDTVPAWLPDSSAVAFHSTRSSKPQIHLVDLATQQVAQLSDHPLGAAAVAPAIDPDGAQLVFWAPTREPDDPSLPYRVTAGIWRFDGIGRLDQAAMEFFLMPVGGGAARQLTENEAVPVGVQWSPDGKRLLHLSYKAADRPTYQLRVHDLAAGTETLIWESEFQGFPPAVAWLPDGRIVRTTANLVVPQGEPLEIVVTAAEPDAAVEVRSDGVEGWLLPILQGDFPAPSLQAPRLIVAPDGRSIFAVVQAGGRLEVWSIPSAGSATPRRIVSGDQATVVLGASDHRLLLATSTMHEPFDLSIANHDGGDLCRLTRLNGERFWPERYFTVRRLDVVGEDGAAVEAWFLRPRGSEGAVPTVLTNHGGPHAGWGHIFSYDFAMLAAAGYGALLVNERGSTGYSPQFASQIHGDLGSLDVSDLERGVDLAISEGLADPDGLAVRGASNGGFLTAWILGRSDRYRAAVIENGMLDVNAALGADLGYVMFPGWMTGGPDDRSAGPSDRLELSPVTYAEGCATPVLIIHHEQDLRCPPTNSDLFFALLKSAGKAPTEMLRLPVTAHNGSSSLGNPLARVVENEALLDWLARYI